MAHSRQLPGECKCNGDAASKVRSQRLASRLDSNTLMFNADNAKAQSRTAAKWSDGHHCRWCVYTVTTLHLLVFNHLGDLDPLHCNACNTLHAETLCEFGCWQ